MNWIELTLLGPQWTDPPKPHKATVDLPTSGSLPLPDAARAAAARVAREAGGLVDADGSVVVIEQGRVAHRIDVLGPGDPRVTTVPRREPGVWQHTAVVAVDGTMTYRRGWSPRHRVVWPVVGTNGSGLRSLLAADALSLPAAAVPCAKYSDDQPRDSDGKFGSGGSRQPKASAKAMLAKQHAVVIRADVQRYSEEHNEPRLASAIGGTSLRDNEPVDVVIRGKGDRVLHGIELKTMVSNTNDKITMGKNAIARKVKWVKREKADFHTVVFDDRLVFGTKPPDTSKRVMYYRRGFGSFRVGTMHRVRDVAELKRLIDTPSKQLPAAARPGSTYPRKYSEDQPRDNDGKFGGGSGGIATMPSSGKSSERDAWFAEQAAKARAMESTPAADAAEWLSHMEDHDALQTRGFAGSMERAVKDWAAEGYVRMREEQRTGDLSRSTVALERAVAIAPRYSGEIHRGLKDLPALPVQGDVWTSKAHDSWSKVREVAAGFAYRKGQGGLILHMQSAPPTAGDVSAVNEAEHEVIVPKGTSLRFDRIDPEPDGWGNRNAYVSFVAPAVARGVVRRDFEEDKHPRDEHGKFSSSDMTHDYGTPAPGDLAFVKALGGSTGAELHKDELHGGGLYVVKQGASLGHIKSEFVADKVYAAVGLSVPAAQLHGGDTKVAEFQQGTSLADLKGPQRAAAEAELRRGFVTDAVLGNWDVIGKDRDNVIVDTAGGVHRIDNGGSLNFRAMGGLKGPGQFGPEVTELESMRNSALNPSAAGVFSKVTPQEVHAQAVALYAKRDAVLAAIHDPKVREQVAARLEWLKSNVINKPPAEATTPPPVIPHPQAHPAGGSKFEETSSEAFTLKGAVNVNHPAVVHITAEVRKLNGLRNKAEKGSPEHAALTAKVAALRAERTKVYAKAVQEELKAGDFKVSTAPKLSAAQVPSVAFKSASDWKSWMNKDPTEGLRPSVESWSATGYTNIRNQQRAGGKLSKKVRDFELAVAHAPRYGGKVYRGIKDLIPDALKAFTTEGSVLTSKSHDSWSKDQKIGHKFSEGHKSSVLLVLDKSSTGGDISSVSHFKNEKEVVVPKGTSYRVTRVVTEEMAFNKVSHTVYLEEV